eukprot:566819_1
MIGASLEGGPFPGPPPNYGYNGYYMHHTPQAVPPPPSPHGNDSHHRNSNHHHNSLQLNTDTTNTKQVKLCYGDKIRLQDGREGILKFIGTIGFNAHEIWYGIILRTPTGTSNGVQQNRVFFECPPSHGLFVTRRDISQIISYAASTGQRFSFGQRIKCDKGSGTIKFIGEVVTFNNMRSLLYGVALTKPIKGGNNGMYMNSVYFTTKPFQGTFLHENEMVLHGKKRRKRKLKKKKRRAKSPRSPYCQYRPRSEHELHSSVPPPPPAASTVWESDHSSGSDIAQEQDEDELQMALSHTTFGNILQKYKQSNARKTQDDPFAPPPPLQIQIPEENHHHNRRHHHGNHFKQTASLPTQHNLRNIWNTPPNVHIHTPTYDPAVRPMPFAPPPNYPLMTGASPMLSPFSTNSMCNYPVPPSPHHLGMNMMSPPSPSRHQHANSSMMRSESSPNPLAEKPYLHQSHSGNVSQEVRAPPRSPRRSQKRKKQRTAHHEYVRNSPFDVRSTRQEFAAVANNIFLSYNNPRGLFKLLYSMSAKLKSSNAKYRILDPSNPAVQKKVFKRADIKNEKDAIGPEAVKEWLRLLGFASQPDTGLFVCPHNQPPKSVIDTAQSVCKLWINKCNKSRRALLNIRKFSKHPKTLQKEIQNSLKESKIKLKPRQDLVLEQKEEEEVLQEEEEEEEEDDGDDEDVDGENDQFKLKELIWSVTHHQNTDHAKVRDVLLLCHPVFTLPKEIISLLKKRFLERQVEIPYHEHCEIQYRVTSFIQHWMRKYYYQDFYLNPSVEQLMEEFTDAMRSYFDYAAAAAADGPDGVDVRGFKLADMIENTMEAQRKQLILKGIIREEENRKSKLTKVLGIRMDKADQDVVRLESVRNRKAASKAAIKELDKFYSIHNKKIAQQLVLISFKHFHGIQPRECLEQNWKGKEKQKRAPNILKVIQNFNDISNYIQVTILNASNANKRGKWITKWLQIATILFEFRDFQTLAAIHGALTSQTVYRQSSAWKKVPAKYRIKFEEFKLIYDSRGGHSNLRKIHSETPPPMVPYAGVLLQILFQIDEGNKNKNEDGSVNFSKLMRLHAAIERITLLQKTNYSIKTDAKLQELISNCMARYSHISSDEMYRKSTTALNKDEPKRLQNKK